MTEFLTFLAGLAGLNPLLALFVAIAAAEAIYIVKELRGESQKEAELRGKIEELLKLHAQTVSAIQEERIDDLKTLIDNYDKTSKSIVSALKRFNKKGEKDE